MNDYIRALNAKFATGDATEHTHRPTLQKLLEKLAPDFLILNEPKRIAVGAPDLTIRKPLGKSQFLPVGYVETKDIGVDLNAVEKSEQLKRYFPLGNVLLTDYLEFRWFIDGKLRSSAQLARLEKGKLKLLKEGEEAVRELLQGFLDHEFLPIGSPQDLAKRMAALCRQIDRIIVTAFKDKQASQLLEGLKEAFERTLLPDLSPEQFADMFAQTLAYGLFAARVHHERETPGQPFTRYMAAREIPKTNPFLRKLFDTITGPELDDEPFVGFVDDLTDLMSYADLGEILKHFGKRTGQQDAVVHFYETFLAAYDPKLRELRGVYYTHEPVVSYIVRSVDVLLKEKFGLKDGLADRSTVKVEVEEGGKKVEKTLPKVLILDPACGTGTFLYAVIDLIRTRFMESGDAGEWSDFVREHLLPRIYGFELLMAPYAVAHLKLAMQLSGHDLEEPLRSHWAYDFRSDERLNIFLTNSLEVTERKVKEQIAYFERFLEDEAEGARAVKRDYPIMVVLANPPYSGHSANKGKWITKLVEDYKKDYLGLDKPAQAKWLQDDYVKFLRWGQWRIEQTGHGILAFITNHAYLDNPTFRGMRHNLLTSFGEAYVLDLHGSTKKREVAPYRVKDENVFDIQQGVAISVYVRRDTGHSVPRLYFAEHWGTSVEKCRTLSSTDVRSAMTRWTAVPTEKPFYLFRPRSSAVAADEYMGWWQLPTILDQNGDPAPGIVTTHDEFAVSWDRKDIAEKMARFLATKSEAEARDLFRLCSQSQWDYRRAKNALKNESWRKEVRRVLYRPFDVRWTVYDRNVAVHRRERVMCHMLSGTNVGLATTRVVEIGRGWEHVFCTADMMVHHAVSLKEGNYLFPLYLYPSAVEKNLGNKSRRPNLSPAFIEEFSGKLGLKFVEDGRGDLKRSFGPEDVFDYIYAVFSLADLSRALRGIPQD